MREIGSPSPAAIAIASGLEGARGTRADWRGRAGSGTEAWVPVPDGRETRPASAHSIGRPALSSRVPRTRQTSFSCVSPPALPASSCVRRMHVRLLFPSHTFHAPRTGGGGNKAICDVRMGGRRPLFGTGSGSWMETNRRSGRRLLPSAAAIVTCSLALAASRSAPGHGLDQDIPHPILPDSSPCPGPCPDVRTDRRVPCAKAALARTPRHRL